MRMEKLTNQLQSALSEAQSIAIGNDHTAIEPEHLLLALLDQQGGSVRPILNRAGFDVSGLQHQFNEQLEKFIKFLSKMCNLLNENSIYVTIGDSSWLVKKEES